MEHTPSPGPPQPSLVEPISDALAWTGRVLFRPFDLGKWFVLGFCAFLAYLGQDGGVNFNYNAGRAAPGETFERFRPWWEAYAPLLVLVAVGVLLVIIGLVVLFTWLSSRGKFMFLDGVLHNRAAVAEPWNRFRTEADSLFGFRVVVGLIALAVLLVMLAPGFYLFFLLFTQSFDGGPGPIIGLLLLWGILGFALASAFGLIRLAVDDFIVPIMWLRRCRVMEAWSELRGVMVGRAGLVALYVLLRLVIGIVTGALTLFLVVCTCCIAALPYIGSVIRLPLYVFPRSYSLGFLSRLNPDYAVLAPGAAPSGEPAPPNPPS